jgi:poly(3-hydroxybutyrate) depolymerase
MMKNALIVLWITCFATLAGASNCDLSLRGKTQTCTIIVNGVTRQYQVYIPTNIPAAPSLVIYLHGAHGGMWEGATNGWTTKAASAGFIAAYPQALPNLSNITSWNLYWNSSFGSRPPDDVGFIKAVILALEAGVAVDHRKVYVTGFSLGAFMTNRVGVELGDMLAAIAPIAGELWQSIGGPLPAEKAPLSVLMINGDADTSVPYCGMTAPYPEATEDDTFNYWQTQNVCKTNSTALCSSGKPTSSSSKLALGCSSSVVVQQYKLIGGIHKWYQVAMNVPPGTSSQPYNSSFNSKTGLTTDDIIWDFFAAHAKP